MYKLSRFDSFNEDKKKDQTKDDDWSQKISLPLPPIVMDFYNKYKAGLIKNDGISVNAQRDNEHVFRTLAELLNSIDIDPKEFIDFLLNNKECLKCQPTEEP